MIRVLHSVSNMDRAGIETMLMNYYRHIDRSRVQFDFLCNKTKPGAYDEEIKAMGGNIYHTPGLNPVKFFEYKKCVIKILQDNPDIKIMHSHNGALAYQSLYAAYKYGLKNRICHAHATTIDVNFKLPLKLLYKTQLNKVSTKFWGCGKESIRFYFGDKIMKSNNYFVLHNAIEEKKFSFNEELRNLLRKQYNLEDKFVIGNVARFMKQKNHTFTLDLFKVILQKEPKAVLMLLGDGELLETMKQKAKELQIEESVMFLGNVSNVNEMYQAMDLFLLPSLFEGLPVVGIEAQTAGLKCIFSNTITDEVKVTDNVEFLDLKKDSLEKWADTILNYKEYERMNTEQEIIDAGYSIEVEAKKLQEIYEKMGEQ